MFTTIGTGMSEKVLNVSEIYLAEKLKYTDASLDIKKRLPFGDYMRTLIYEFDGVTSIKNEHDSQYYNIAYDPHGKYLKYSVSIINEPRNI